jgi:hypothetical protein
MKKGDEKEPRTPRTRVVSEAVVAALSEGPPQRRRRTRVVSEAIVAAIPEAGEAEPGGGADDDAGAEPGGGVGGGGARAAPLH